MRIALVLGGAASVWSDFEAATALGEFSGVVGCNDAAAGYRGDLDAMVSLHGDKLGLWLARRDYHGHPPPARVFASTDAARGAPRLTHRITDFTEYRFPGQTDTGSSGLFALKVALEDLGFDRAVLCGVPMTAELAHYFDPKAWKWARNYLKGWEQALPAIGDRARSMGGWTAEKLGAPDAHWIGGA